LSRKYPSQVDADVMPSRIVAEFVAEPSVVPRWLSQHLIRGLMVSAENYRTYAQFS